MSSQPPAEPGSSSPTQLHEPGSSPLTQPQEPGPESSGDLAASTSTSLDGLRDRPLAEHADVYQGLHADLQGALADIDDA